MNGFRMDDLPARSARYARTNAWIGFALILISIGSLMLARLTSLIMIVPGAIAALVSLPASIAGVVFYRRCLSPRPEGPPWVLVASIVLCLAYASLLFILMSLGGMH
jgi:hypothetical protein